MSATIIARAPAAAAPASPAVTIQPATGLPPSYTVVRKSTGHVSTEVYALLDRKGHQLRTYTVREGQAVTQHVVDAISGIDYGVTATNPQGRPGLTWSWAVSARPVRLNAMAGLHVQYQLDGKGAFVKPPTGFDPARLTRLPVGAKVRVQIANAGGQVLADTGASPLLAWGRSPFAKAFPGGRMAIGTDGVVLYVDYPAAVPLSDGSPHLPAGMALEVEVSKGQWKPLAAALQRAPGGGTPLHGGGPPQGADVVSLRLTQGAAHSQPFAYTWNSNFDPVISIATAPPTKVAVHFRNEARRTLYVGATVVRASVGNTPAIDRAIDQLDLLLRPGSHAAAAIRPVLSAMRKALANWRADVGIDLERSLIVYRIGQGQALQALQVRQGMYARAVTYRDRIVVSSRLSGNGLDGTIYHELLHAQQPYAGYMAEDWARRLAPGDVEFLNRALGNPYKSLMGLAGSEYWGATDAARRLRIGRALSISLAEAYPSYYARRFPQRVHASSDAFVRTAAQMLDIWKTDLRGLVVHWKGQPVELGVLATTHPDDAVRLFNLYGGDAIHAGARSTTLIDATLDAWLHRLKTAPDRAARKELARFLRDGIKYRIGVNANAREVMIEPEPPSPHAADHWGFQNEIADRMEALAEAPGMATLDLSNPKSLDDAIAAERRILGSPGTSAAHDAAADRLARMLEFKTLEAGLTNSVEAASPVASHLGLAAASDAVIARRTTSFLEMTQAAARASARASVKAAGVLAEPLQIAITAAQVVYELEANRPEAAARAISGLVTWPRDLAAAANPGQLVGHGAHVFPDRISDWHEKDFLALFNSSPNPVLALPYSPGAIALNLCQLIGSCLYDASLPLMKRYAVWPAPGSTQDILMYNFMAALKSGKPGMMGELLQKAYVTGLLTERSLQRIQLAALGKDDSQVWPLLVKEIDWKAIDPKLLNEAPWQDWVFAALSNFNQQTLHLHESGRIGMDAVAGALRAVGVPAHIVNVVLPAAITRLAGATPKFSGGRLVSFSSAKLRQVLRLLNNDPTWSSSIVGVRAPGRDFSAAIEPFVFGKYAYMNKISKGNGTPYWNTSTGKILWLLDANFSTFVLHWLGLKRTFNDRDVAALRQTPSWKAAMLGWQQVAGTATNATAATFAQVMARLAFSPSGQIAYRAKDMAQYLSLVRSQPGVPILKPGGVPN